MATIITVHGTNASGPEFGDKWWQRGSPFMTHLLEMVESDDGQLRHEQVVWDGRNSEASRRRAATDLLSMTKELEKNRESYVLLGHSHGGSIISIALQRAAAKLRGLPGLRKWVTVGTPFIQHQRHKRQFMRVGLMGKAALLSLYLMFLSALLLMMRRIDVLYSSLEPALPLILVLVAAVLVSRGVLSRFEPKDLRFHGKLFRKAADRRFGSLWLPLWHSHDEAINGLSRVKMINFDIFPKGFAVPSLVMVSVVLLPLFFISLAFSDDVVAWMMSHMRDRTLGGLLGGSAEIQSLSITDRLFVLLWGVPLDLMTNKAGGVTIPVMGIVWLLILGALALSTLYVKLAQLAVTPLSRVASVWLNRGTWQQLRALAFGNDTVGEVAVDCSVAPAWALSSFSSLPRELSAEISAVSDAAAASAIGKLRAAIDRFAFVESGEDKREFVGQYLSWDELIHTCYFNVPRFRKLVAYGISAADGFRATEKFKADPDYTVVAKWYEEIIGTELGAAEDAR